MRQLRRETGRGERIRTSDHLNPIHHDGVVLRTNWSYCAYPPAVNPFVGYKGVPTSPYENVAKTTFVICS